MKAVNIGEEQPNAFIMETKIIVKAINNGIGCCCVKGQRSSLKSVDMVEIIRYNREGILNQICGIFTAAFTEDNLGTTLIFFNHFVVECLVLGVL